MPPALLNVLVGLLQPALPSLIAYGLSQGWFSQSILATTAAIATAAAAAIHSAATTQVVAPKA